MSIVLSHEGRYGKNVCVITIDMSSHVSKISTCWVTSTHSPLFFSFSGTWDGVPSYPLRKPRRDASRTSNRDRCLRESSLPPDHDLCDGRWRPQRASCSAVQGVVSPGGQGVDRTPWRFQRAIRRTERIVSWASRGWSMRTAIRTRTKRSERGREASSHRGAKDPSQILLFIYGLFVCFRKCLWNRHVKNIVKSWLARVRICKNKHELIM